ncbi:MAG: iron ABC transporter permease [Clostridiales Family XIII bacterium]|jgi:iron complex transport system permease protein|nr:iron ABC transporter permease [Clostridiales Family XIII bacterium]
MTEVLQTFSTKALTRRIFLLAVALVCTMALSFLLGSYFAWPSQVMNDVMEHFGGGTLSDPKLDAALFNIRIPRIITVVLVGMALSVAGASYQGMFKNPLVSPDILGASAGASFGACLALLMNLGNAFIQLFAFVFGLIAVGLVMLINRAVRGDALLGLILGGILVGTLFSSGTSIIKLVADADDKLPAITFWLMGSFAGAQSDDVPLLLIPMAIGFALVLWQSWNLNVMSFGEDEARSLGLNTSLTRALVILGATLLTASSIAVAGVIGWIGLVVPHLTRAIVGPNYTILLPTTMLTGAIFLLIVDNFARLVYSVEIPIGLLTSILGVPFFIFIYRRNLRGW